MSLELERERVVQQLCAAYANDQLTTGELESRFEMVYRAREPEQVLTALHGIAIPRGAAMPAPLYQAPANPPAIRDREKRYLGFFSEVKKEGAWTAPPFARVRAILGTVVLDLREADIPVDGMFIDAEATLGEIKIILPLGVGADVDCTALLGEVTDRTKPGTPGLPFVRVRGGANLGTIVVETKLPKKDKMESWRAQMKSWLGRGD